MARWIWLLLMLAVASPACASGWNDYRLQIDPNFLIVRANSIDVVLTRTSGSVVYVPTDYPGVGPICGYIVTPTHILLKHHGRLPRNLFAGDTFEEVDTSRQFYFIVGKNVGSGGLFQFQQPPSGEGGGGTGERDLSRDPEFLRLLAEEQGVGSTWKPPPDRHLRLRELFQEPSEGEESGTGIRGPYSEAEFRNVPEVQAILPLQWQEPSNPNVVTPVVGTLYFLAMSAWILGWPLLVLGLIVVGGVIFWRRRRGTRGGRGFPVRPASR